MFIFLSKFLPLFVYPLGLACLLVLLAIFLRRNLRWQRIILVAALVVLWLGGNHWVAMGLMRSLEWRYLPPKDVPHAEAIVVLGGGTRPAIYPRAIAEIGEESDRMLYAAWLYQHGAAPNILVSSGSIDWLSSGGPAAYDMAAFLEILGVPQEAIWIEAQSRNTAENASESRKLLEAKGITRIILVTSAFHMPRSVPLFEHQGFEVIPAPTDYAVTQADWDYLTRPSLSTQLMNLIPSAGNLEMTSRALKEYIGIFVYRLRGW